MKHRRPHYAEHLPVAADGADFLGSFFLELSFWGQKESSKVQNEAIFQGYVNNIKRLLRSDPTTLV